MSPGIREYGFETCDTALIQRLPIRWFGRHDVLTTTDGGGLGYATVLASKLYVWSKAAGTDEDEGWSQSRVIELDELLPVPVNAISWQVRKVYEAREVYEFIGIDKYIVIRLFPTGAFAPQAHNLMALILSSSHRIWTHEHQHLVCFGVWSFSP
ncbi:hypothetical protein BAE44_0020863 [Dichanthelium oligosanthes]|uniref:Uncharacterized protein n=1 Tax=Dichanthelium oligosanthes TaxID=888268 RepID=A0A1E5UYZ9_9POAL|nr:hypothetical protein BAE44_0020863 [Dichanthelium oligosanthes]